MARPQKNTVDYFPHLIGNGKKMTYIETKYGNDGYATWFKILETLAATENHFLNLNEEVETMFLSARCRVSVDILLAIIDDLVRLKVFNKEAWEARVLWSETFMESIKDAYKRRESKTHDFESLCKHLLRFGIHISCNNPVSVDINAGKEKERKLKEKESIIVAVIPESPEPKNEEEIDPPNDPPKKTIEERKLAFKISLEKYVETYGRETLNKFYRHWTEMNEGGRKMRFEMEKVFEPSKRLAKWKDYGFENQKSHQNGKNNQNNRARRHDPVSTEGYGKL